MDDVEKTTQMAHEGKVAAIAEGAPQSDKPLETGRVNVLSKVVGEALDELGDGHLPDLGLEQVDGEVRTLPPKLYAGLVALFGFFETLPEGERYRANVEQLAGSSDGIAELVALVGAAKRDKKLARAIRRASGGDLPMPSPGAMPPAQREDATEGTDLSELV